MKFVLNDKEYESKEFDFELQCAFEERGYTMDDLLVNRKTLMLREYFCMCSGLSRDEAMKEINEQVIKYGELDDFSNAMNEEMERSDFIKAILKKMEETEVSQTPKKTNKTKSENTEV